MKYLIGIAIIGGGIYLAVQYVGDNRPTKAKAPATAAAPADP